jgi:hypothetical protein
VTVLVPQDLDKTVVNSAAEMKARAERAALRKKLMKREVKGMDKPAMCGRVCLFAWLHWVCVWDGLGVGLFGSVGGRDLDRDRRERRRDVRGETTKFEVVKEKDRHVTQEEKAQKYREAAKRKVSPAAASAPQSLNKTSPAASSFRGASRPK